MTPTADRCAAWRQPAGCSPPGWSRPLGHRAFGPLLSARLAGLLDTDKAVEAVARGARPAQSPVRERAEAVLIARHDDTIQERLDRRQAQR
jgi:hypothetical protein